MKKKLKSILVILIALFFPITGTAELTNDYGYLGTINVYVDDYSDPIQIPDKVIPIAKDATGNHCNWYLSNNNGNVIITSQGWWFCYIKGLKVGSRIELSFSGSCWIGSNMELWHYKGYYYVNVLEKKKVTSISISPSPVFLSPNDEVQLNAKIYPSDAYKKDVIWKSSDNTVVSVDNTGKLSAKAYGNATITCSATDDSGVTDTCDVTVADKVPVTSIMLSDTLVSLGTESNRGKYLYATILPDNATDKSLTWTSSNPDVATVYKKSTANDDGTYSTYISTKGLGTTIITCSADDGSGVQATCTVNVYKYPDGATFSEKTSEGIEVWYRVLDNSNGTCSVNGVSSNNTGTITIPSVVKGYTVISIGKSAFYSNKSITTVNLPTTVTSIGNEAFYNCTSLTSIKLNNVTYLGEEVFYNCTALSSITGINQMEYIGDNAFYNTPWYDKLPDGPLYLGKVLYRYKGSMPENTIFSVKDGTVSITSGAFANRTIGLFQSDNRHLVSLYIPKSVSNLYGCSSYCPNLERIVIDPANETYDSRNDCNAIIEKSSNTLIAGCKGTVIPETVTAIGERAFEYSGIASVVIPNSVDSIADYVFNGSSLASITIGSGLRTLGTRVFLSCSNLESIIVSETNPYFDSRNDCNAIIETQTNRLVVGTHTSTIPYTVKNIGSYAFYTSTNKLQNVRIHDGIETIEDYAFYNQSTLTTVTIGKGIKNIGKYAFAYCNNLKGVHSLSDTPIDLDETTFRTSWNSEKQQYDFSKATLFVPRGSMINYMTTEGWSNFEKIVEVDDDALIDGERFTDETIEGIELTYMVTDAVAKTCELVESPISISGKVTIPDKPKGYTVTSIVKDVFYGYKTERNITEVVIPEHVTSIGYDAFYYVKTLTSVIIPNSVTTIEGWAFGSCGLTFVDIPNSVDSIGNYAFSSNSLESITIGNGLRKLGENPFRSNSKLKSITVSTDNSYFDSRDNCNAIIEKNTNKLIVGCTTTLIPQSVKAIGNYAFSTSDYDTYSITLPDQVETIGEYAFAYSYNPRALTIGKGVKKIGKNAFYGCNALRSIHVLSQEPVDIDETVFKSNYTYFPDSIYNNVVLYVPIGARINYMTTPCWNKFKHIVETDGLTPCEGDLLELAGSPLIFAVTSTSEKTSEVIGVKSSAEGRLSIPSQTNGYSVKGLGYDAFYNKKGITHIDIPTSVTYLDDYALYYCSDLESVELPSSLERIGYFALGGLGKINSIVIPKTVKDIDRGIFTADSLLMSVTVESGNPVYDSRGGCNAVIETATNTLVAGIKSTVIPNDIKTIGYFAFNSQKNMETMSIPNSVTCIDEYAFNNCGLKSITISASVDSIGSWAFRLCRDLSSVISLIENPVAINENVFYSDNVNSEWLFTSATLYVPIGCKEKYLNTEGWKNFKNIIEGKPDGIESIIMQDSSANAAEVYNLSGQRIIHPRKGIYIKGGKKMFVK